MEYITEYDNARELEDKVSLQTWALFVTAEKYLNGATFQLKRINEAKKKHTSLEGLSLETHSYLVYIDLVGRCFDSIYSLNDKDKELKNFWENYKDPRDSANLFTPLREARNYVSHINENVEHAVSIGSFVGEVATFVTVFDKDALIYYAREEVKKKKDRRPDDVKIFDKIQKRYRFWRFSKKSIPITEAEFKKVRTVYEEIFDILNRRNKDHKYGKDDPEGYAIICDGLLIDYVGPIDRFIGGLVSSLVVQGVLFEEK
jgi:hypothetical protein